METVTRVLGLDANDNLILENNVLNFQIDANDGNRLVSTDFNKSIMNFDIKGFCSQPHTLQFNQEEGGFFCAFNKDGDLIPIKFIFEFGGWIVIKNYFTN